MKYFFTAKILPISQRYSSYNNVRKIQYILDLRCPTQAVSLCIKFISTIYKTREKFSWCTSTWMLISIISVCPLFSFEITIHRRGIWISYASMNPGIYVYILDLNCFSRLIVPNRTKIILILTHLKLMKDNTTPVTEPYVTTSWSSLHCDLT